MGRPLRVEYAGALGKTQRGQTATFNKVIDERKG